jgi:hypothetical protein
MTGRTPPWGVYPPEAGIWLAEVLALPPDAEPGALPAGPRWKSFKIGTYAVDRAVATTRRSLADLVGVPADDILGLATGSPVPDPRP